MGPSTPSYFMAAPWHGLQQSQTLAKSCSTVRLVLAGWLLRSAFHGASACQMLSKIARDSLKGAACARQSEEDVAVRDEKLKQAQSNLRRATDTHHSMSAASQDGCSARHFPPQTLQPSR